MEKAGGLFHGGVLWAASLDSQDRQWVQAAMLGLPFYLIVALRIEAVVMFPVLVCTVYVSAVLTARKPGNTGDRKNETDALRRIVTLRIKAQVKQVWHSLSSCSTTYTYPSPQGYRGLLGDKDTLLTLPHFLFSPATGKIKFFSVTELKERGSPSSQKPHF